MAYHSFQDLEVWKRSCALAVQVDEHLRECRDDGLRDVGMLDNEAMQRLVRELKEISRMLTALAHSLQPKTEN